VLTQAANTYELFSASAERHADRLAVVDGRGRRTYAELATRVDEIAAAIIGEGVSPGGRVGLLLDRTADAVAAMLAVWKCGMAYVPLAAATPPARANAVFRSSAAQLLLTDGAVDAAQLDGLRTLDLRAVEPPAAPAGLPRPAGDDLAYVIYTSGTTGRPKGVMIEHRAVMNLAAAHQERIYQDFVAEDRGLRATFAASFAFDGAVERLLLLLSGHALFMLGEEQRSDPQKYLAYAGEHELDVLDLTPAFLRSMIRCGLLRNETWRPRLALVGGEAIPESLWRELAASEIAFYNVYGPTETTVNASVTRIAGERPHLGHALANTQIYVLTEDGSRAADGEEGEIHVAGAGVARGYDGMPELTAAKFKPNPFADGDPLYEVMYATGDRGRFRPDGTLEFLGRTDEQIKLRGFRIEPEEITTLLCRRPEVEDAVVRVRTSADGEHQRLVAYVLSATEARRELSDELRALLREQLPDYMVPGRIVVVDRYPLTATGKLDDAALAALDEEHDDGEAPSGSLDGVTPELVAIWQEVLDARDIDPNASFFELGGHSLSAVAMIGRVNEAFDVELPIATVFTAPTIASFDLALRDALQESASAR
jgi:amino acid adenylation domain-containing protein